MTECTSIYTEYGRARWATAERTGVPLPMWSWSIALGDGSGEAVEPDEEQSALVNEVFRAPVNRIYPHDTDLTRYYVEMVIPATAGGWTMREVGVFDEHGGLVLVGNLPGLYKSTPAERVTTQDVVAIEFFVSNAGLITLHVDPSAASVNRAMLEARLGEFLAALTTGVTAGTYRRVQVNTTGLVIAGDNPTTLAGYGITDATPLAAHEALSAALAVVVDALEGAIQRIDNAVGDVIWTTGATARPGTVIGDGSVLLRTDHPRLWAFVQASGNLAANDAAWLALQADPANRGVVGCYSPGDGATTFRLPQICGAFVRAADSGQGVDPARAVASTQGDQNREHHHLTMLRDAGVAGPNSLTADNVASTVSATGGESNAHIGGLTGNANVGMTSAAGGTEARPLNLAYLALIVT